MYIQCKQFIIECTKLYKFIVQNFSKNLHNFLCSIYKIYTFKVHNLSQNVHSLVYSGYTILWIECIKIFNICAQFCIFNIHNYSMYTIFQIIYIIYIVGSQIVAHTLIGTGNEPNKPNTINLWESGLKNWAGSDFYNSYWGLGSWPRRLKHMSELRFYVRGVRFR